MHDYHDLKLKRPYCFFIMICLWACFFLTAGITAAEKHPDTVKAEPAEKPVPTAASVLETQDNQPIAMVGNVPIPRWMYDNAMKDRLGKKWRDKNYPEKDIRETSEAIIDNLITMSLLEQEAKKAGISLSQGAGALRSKVVEGSFKNRQAFLDTLARAGMTEAQYMAIWQQQAMVNTFIESEIEKTVQIEEKAIRALYDERKPNLKRPPQIRARHILIKADKKSTAEAQKQAAEKATEILAQLRQGGDFEKLAEKHSHCSSKEKGGDLGWFSENDMVRSFSQAAFKLKENEISDVVKTRYGYHIIQKTGEQPEGTAEYNSVKNALQEELVKKKIRETLNEYVAALKKNVKIEIFK